MAAPLSSLGAQPVLRLGAPSPGGLRLPDASATAATLYAPRGVCFTPDGRGLVVADTGNHRLLIWRELLGDHRPADLVLGQSDFESEGPQARGRGPEAGLNLPCGLVFVGERLFVCDAWNHRILVWNRLPEENGARPDLVLGQDDLSSTLKNRGAAIGPSGLDCPYGIAVIDEALVVADTQNRRLLVWDGVPESDRPADRVIGQDDFEHGEENRGRGVGRDTLRWPHALASTRAGELLVADAGNHRLLAFGGIAEGEESAALQVGQKDFESAFELPHVPQGPARLRFPYGLVADGDRIYVADTANNRILIFDAPLKDRAEAMGVLGQSDFDGAGENRWSEVAPDTLCWPYGLALHGSRLAVADSGNNRVVVWEMNPS